MTMTQDAALITVNRICVLNSDAMMLTDFTVHPD